MPKIIRLLLAAAVAAALVACSGGDGDGAEPAKGGASTTAKGQEPAPTRFTLTAADVQAMADQAPGFPEDVKAQVTKVLDAWLEQAVLGPLETGKPPGALDALFTPPALARLAGPGTDRAAVLEDGAVKGKITDERANAALTALTAGTGEVVLVTASLDVAQTVKTDDGAVAVVRTGELVLVPADGWRIDAYTVRTARDSVAGGGK